MPNPIHEQEHLLQDAKGCSHDRAHAPTFDQQSISQGHEAAAGTPGGDGWADGAEAEGGAGMKATNGYVALLQHGDLYQRCPKAVFAAMAVSYASHGGDFLEGVEAKLIKEWWILYQNGIVPQKPPMPKPLSDEVIA